MHCTALTIQKSLRDLATLPALVDEITWVETERAEDELNPLVVCALWLWEQPEVAKEILHVRSQSGRMTLVVPRFRAGDLSQVLKSPTTLIVKASEFQNIDWEGRQYKVSGTSIFESALHAGKWATSLGVGTTVLGYRSHAAAAPIVLCSAAVTGRPLGVQIEEQRALLEKIFETATAQSPARTTEASSEVKSAGRAQSLDTFLEDEGGLGAAFLMMRLAAGQAKGEMNEVARDTLGIQLTPDQFTHLEERIPEVTDESIEEALRQHGWSAYLRRIEALARRDA